MARYLVEGHGGAEEGVDDVGVVVELLVHHEGEDAHLGGAAVVELDGALLGDGLGVPSGSLELGSLDVVLAGSEAELDGTDEGDGLGNASSGDGVEGGEAGLHGGEGEAEGDVSGQADAGGGHDVAEDGQLRDAAVLGLDGAEAVEACLVGGVKQA